MVIKILKKVNDLFEVKYGVNLELNSLYLCSLDNKNAINFVSRTSKTPLSMYLAHKRIRAANLPLVPEVDPPEELYWLPPKKIMGIISGYSLLGIFF